MILAFKDWFMYFFKTTWFLNMDQFFTWWSTEEKANFSMLEVKLSVELSDGKHSFPSTSTGDLRELPRCL